MCRPIFAISDAEWNLDSYPEKYNATLNIGVKSQVKATKQKIKSRKIREGWIALLARFSRILRSK